MMPAPTKPPVNPDSIFRDILAGISGLSVDEDARSPRQTKAIR